MRRPRFHLSTALLLTLLAGMLLWLNMRPVDYQAEVPYSVVLRPGQTAATPADPFFEEPHVAVAQWRRYGWPFTAADECWEGGCNGYHREGFIYDALVALAVLLAVGVLVEVAPGLLTRPPKGG